MKKKSRKALAVIAGMSLMIGSISFPVGATPQDDLNDVNSQINDINSQLNDAQAEADIITEEISRMMGIVEIYEENLAVKNQELEKIEKELDAAKKKEQDQNAIMKARIKSIYEKGNTEYLTAFLEAKSIAELVSRMEYASTIYEYDKTMLDQLRKAKEKVEKLQKDVKKEAAEIQGMIKELDNQKYNLEVKLDVLKDTISDYEYQVSVARAQAAEIRAAIEEENRRIQNSGGGAPAGGSAGGSYTFTDDGSTGAAIVTEALKYVGNPYVWGGTSLTNGADCSGFVQTLYRMFGISLPRVTWDQGVCGVSVPYSEARPGDLIYYGAHIAIYMGGGQIVHASYEAPYEEGGGIRVGNATFTTIIDVRRVC